MIILTIITLAAAIAYTNQFVKKANRYAGNKH